MEELSKELQERRELVRGAWRRVTLDGHRASLAGWRLPYAVVTDLETGAGFEWSWEAAKRVVANGGAFRS